MNKEVLQQQAAAAPAQPGARTQRGVHRAANCANRRRNVFGGIHNRMVDQMNQIDDRQRSINAKLERLRKRLEKCKDAEARAVLAGLLDLLGDEL